jgi:predicted glycoside hydrolase/deacetylase ChbG (UPF0249 family)
MGKLLIINADDFGLDEDVNCAIIEAHRGGLVRSASLMVNMPAAESAARMARREARLEVGLHINVSEGFCAASHHGFGPFVDSEGRFRFDTGNVAGSIRRWRRWFNSEPELASHFAAEIKCQVERFQNFGLSLAHLNAHHYMPLIHPRLYASYVRVAETLGLPFRGLCEPMLELLGTPIHDMEEMEAVTRGARAPSPFVSISNPLDAADKRDLPPEQHRSLIECKLTELASRPDVASVEVIVHPAELREGLGDSYAWARRLETTLVRSTRFRRTVEGLGYSLGGYSSLVISR